MSIFRATDKQREAQQLLGGPQTHTMLFGGSRSGKTFILVRAVLARAIKAPNSRHAILRQAFDHVKRSVGMDTLPKVADLCFPSVKLNLDKQMWVFRLPNGSEIWLGGLDDKERVEKVLGQEHATIYLNECSQISYDARSTAVTRLAQVAEQKLIGKGELPQRMYYDCNPPSKMHWSYRLFVEQVDPETRRPLTDPEDYQSLLMNPLDNRENLPDKYIKTLEALPARMRKRFLEGQFADATPNALWTPEIIDKWRHEIGELPDFVRIGVSVDPSGADDENNAGNDEIGVCVGALGADGNAYVLEDLTLKAGPAKWGKTAVGAFKRHQADFVCGEINFGGAMVEHVIQTAREDGDPRIPYKKVTASRGKVVRAEPISALHEQGKIRFLGRFDELEDELCSFSTTGYTGAKSPNRADAFIWLMSEFFPGMVQPKNTWEPIKYSNQGIR